MGSRMTICPQLRLAPQVFIAAAAHTILYFTRRFLRNVVLALSMWHPSEHDARVQAAGLRMAALTTLSRLLEAKVVELEGDDGTGPLETDIALLQARRSEQDVSGAGVLIYMHESACCALLPTCRLAFALCM